MNETAHLPFRSLYRHDFARVAVAIPEVRVADPVFNTDQTIALARRADQRRALVTLFPELGITAYSNDDLFQQHALLDEALRQLQRLRDESRDLRSLLLVGLPLVVDQKLFNCAVALHGGHLLAVAPKSYIPNYREFYEKRHFASAHHATSREITLLDERVPFGNDIILEAATLPGFAVHMEVCEDVWVPIPPSTYAAFAGATVLANLSASNVTIGKADYRQSLAGSQSAKCIACYMYSAAGPGESTTDLSWDGHAMVYENGRLLAEGPRFSREPALITADIDYGALIQDRMRMTSFTDNATRHAGAVAAIRRIPVEIAVPTDPVPLEREISRFPYVPSDHARRDERCYEAYNIQVTGLVKRLRAAGIKNVIIGISGGLDSTQALIVSARAMDLLGLPRENIRAYTMPGFATSTRTRENAWQLMQSLGVTAGEIDIRPACMQMFTDIDHPFARGEEVYDVTFENVQAGERTSHLFRLANRHGGLVVGTGDLSELALGWATYGVGDHMSHYAVNASVPKTLVQHLIRWVIEKEEFPPKTAEVLQRILGTEISPELVPGDGGAEGPREAPTQSSEEKIGPYELQDFHLYYLSRFGFRPSKVAFLAEHAWSDPSRGMWPEDIPTDKRNRYSIADIKAWLRVFVSRFFQSTQFKRSCIPNGPKVGSGGSLSPRGDWRAPSDSSAAVWLSELEEHVPDE
ncbi:MAG: NAD(+) synthase [Spirochaetota bacterium]